MHLCHTVECITSIVAVLLYCMSVFLLFNPLNLMWSHPPSALLCPHEPLEQHNGAWSGKHIADLHFILQGQHLGIQKLNHAVLPIDCNFRLLNA